MKAEERPKDKQSAGTRKRERANSSSEHIPRARREMLKRMTLV